jgi:hypothetical protein
MPLVIGVALLAGAVASGLYFANRYHWIDLPGLGPQRDWADAHSAENITTIYSGRVSELLVTQGNTVEEDSSHPSLAWIRSSLKTASSNGATDGVSINVPDALVAQIQGKRILVTVSAKGGGRQSSFAAAYSAGSAGSSGWFVFEPASEFRDFSFAYRVPRNAAELNHVVGIWSDISGRNAPLAISRVTITAEP